MMANKNNQIDNDEVHEFYDSHDFFENGNSIPMMVKGQKNDLCDSSQFYTCKIDDQTVIEACKKSDLKLIEEYLESGHDINEFLITGWTLLLHAALYAQTKAVKYLLDFRASPNLHQDGFTPLMALCKCTTNIPDERLKCLKLLIESKTDVNATNKMKITPLMYACEFQEINFILEILKYTDYINYADNEQRTALFYAVTKNRYEVVKILIQKGADITWMNSNNLTPYDLAVTKGFEELLDLLEIACEDNKPENIGTESVTSWLNLFPIMDKIDKDAVDSDVAALLYGMGLESYKICFRGVNLRRFLDLKEDDLERLGIDMSVHRKRFFDELHRFHNHTWSNDLVKINKTQPISLFEAIKVLGSINKQLSVMSSSLYFSRNCLESIESDQKLNINDKDTEKLKVGIQELREVTFKIQDATSEVHHVTEMINEENLHLTLPIFIISRNYKKNNNRWIFVTIFTLLSIYFFRTRMRKFWSRKSTKSWKNIFSIFLLN